MMGEINLTAKALSLGIEVMQCMGWLELHDAIKRRCNALDRLERGQC